jgi:hypothetical protein
VIRWYQLQKSTFVGRRRSSGGVLRVTGVLATVLCLTFDGAPNPRLRCLPLDAQNDLIPRNRLGRDSRGRWVRIVKTQQALGRR